MMKRIIFVFCVLLMLYSRTAWPADIDYNPKNYDYGDLASATLMTKAWNALENRDYPAVMAYTDRCLKMYSKEALQMQADLDTLPKGDPEHIASYWALNDVATSLFLQAEVYVKLNDFESAERIYNKLIKEYRFGQCWDPKGWFWQPAQAAKMWLKMFEEKNFTGEFSTAPSLVEDAGRALQQRKYEQVIYISDQCIQKYSSIAKKQQHDYDTDHDIAEDQSSFRFYALNAVAEAHLMKGKALFYKGEKEKAMEEFLTIKEQYPAAYTHVRMADRQKVTRMVEYFLSGVE
ncbi:MAG: tetratricopeptide repeat protein [Candidatus Omnitrophica bacterium]|nr:tetratricopeptide repeat protein [Candidatus Omnitrophota bacterium]